MKDTYYSCPGTEVGGKLTSQPQHSLWGGRRSHKKNGEGGCADRGEEYSPLVGEGGRAGQDLRVGVNCCVAEINLDLLIPLPPFPQCWDYRHDSHAWLYSCLF